MPDIIKTLVEEARTTGDQAHSLLSGESKQGFQKSHFNERQVAEFTKILNEAYTGDRRAEYILREASATGDFPYLMADILDRGLMAAWSTSIPNWQAFCAQGTLRDFRQAKAVGIEGMGQVLDSIGERAEYPERGPSEEAPKYRQVAKYGGRFGLSWEMLVNDDLDALRDLPQKLVQAARRSEALAVTKLYVGSAGPNTNVYSAGSYGNVITGNPVLGVAGLTAGFLQFAGMKDIDGFPLMIDAYTLVIPPALEVTANNLMNATTAWISSSSTTGWPASSTSSWTATTRWSRHRTTPPRGICSRARARPVRRSRWTVSAATRLPSCSSRRRTPPAWAAARWLSRSRTTKSSTRSVTASVVWSWIRGRPWHRTAPPPKHEAL
jgi:hypothetical protein